VATVGEKLGIGDAVLQRILNHTAPTKSDVLYRHYFGLNSGDVAGAMAQIQHALIGLMGKLNKVSRRDFGCTGSVIDGQGAYRIWLALAGMDLR